MALRVLLQRASMCVVIVCQQGKVLEWGEPVGGWVWQRSHWGKAMMNLMKTRMMEEVGIASAPRALGWHFQRS